MFAPRLPHGLDRRSSSRVYRMTSVRASSPEPIRDVTSRVPVLLPLPLSGAYDYAVPEGLVLAPGDYVTVPLGSRRVIGCVWDGPGGQSGAAAIAEARLRAVVERL